MSKKATIHTIESLLARTVEHGNCKDWTGYAPNKTPKVFHNGKMQSVRAVLLELQGKAKPPKGFFLATRCQNPYCVNPEHIIARSPKQHAVRMAKCVDHENPVRLMRITEKAQIRRKLSDEQVQTILLDTRSCRELGELFQVNQSLISRIRRGQAHRLTMAKNNPFWQLYG